ncbi:MAG: hypothetical protein ACT4P1_15875 [Sporichthyaceae bacterium]
MGTPSRFEITQITAQIAGHQPYTLHGHIHTRAGIPAEVLTVSLGAIAIYCHDLASVSAFAAAWRVAAGFAGPVLPARARWDNAAPGQDLNSAGVILRVSGAPTTRHQVNGIPAAASPNGAAHVRVAVGSLVVHAYDLAAVTSWNTAWTHAEHTALRLWPTRDAFTTAEDTARERIARTGAEISTTRKRTPTL